MVEGNIFIQAVQITCESLQCKSLCWIISRQESLLLLKYPGVFIISSCYKFLPLACHADNPSFSPLSRSFIPILKRLKGSLVFLGNRCHINNVMLICCRHTPPPLCYFCNTHVAWEVSGIAGFLLGRTAQRQKLISNSTEINDFALTSLAGWHNKDIVLF